LRKKKLGNSSYCQNQYQKISGLPKFFQILAPLSGVAVALFALRPGAKIIVALTNKICRAEVKNYRRKSVEEAKAKHLLLLLLFFFYSNKQRFVLETYSTKL